MSAKLKPLDLTGAIVGTTATINFNQFMKFSPNDITKKAMIRVLNESGCGLDTTFQQSGNYHFLPAGAWGTFEVQPNDASISVTVTYILPNPPVSLVQAIYYLPGEQVPQSFTLGNSPIGIGGTIPVSNVTLSNEGNPINTLVIDMGPAGNLNVVQIWNDHFIWSVVQSGVAHQVFKGNISGNPLQLGQAGDIVEVLGSFTIDQNAIVTGTISTGTLTLTNGGVMSGGDWNLGTHGITASGIIVATTFESLKYADDVGNDGILITRGATTRLSSAGQVVLQVPSSTTQLTVNTTDVLSQLQFSAPKYILTGASGQYNMYAGSISRVSTGTYTSSTGAHTTNHNLGGTPTNVLTTGGSSTGTATTGSDTYGATTFTSIEGAGAVTMRFRAERS